MKNCGSSGVMSSDPDRTIISLFDSNNKPHVLVTYSPNEKRISGDEGVGSSEVKPEYHEYIIDLADTIGANFDTTRTKSKFLKLKYLLKNKSKDVKPAKISKTPSIWDEYFKFSINGVKYISDSYTAISENDIKKANELIKNKTVELYNNQRNLVKNIFNHYNSDILKKHGIQYVPVEKL